jgi:UDPglucose 6-dehydrogenase
MSASAKRQPVGVIGVGYVGLVTAACFADLGHEVVCLDVKPERIAALRDGTVPIYEPGVDRLLERNRARLRFTLELGDVLERCRIVFVCVDTPSTHSGDADLSRVRSVIDALPATGDRFILVMKSTVPVGTGEKVRSDLDARGLGHVGYVSNPEFLREGRAVSDFLEPDRVIIGASDAADARAVADLYVGLGAPVITTDVPSAEMIKYASNAFLATKISFINEIANVCEETGADVLEVARGMGLDHRIGTHFLKPGIGFGGSCFPGDETVLARLRGRTRLMTFEQLWDRVAAEKEELEEGLIEPHRLEVLSWPPGTEQPVFLPVMCLTRRDYEGELVEARTKMGRQVRCTPDHGWVVGDGRGGEPSFKLAADLTAEDWVPIALGRGEEWEGTKVASLMAAAEAAELSPQQLIVRPRRELVDELVRRPIADRARVFAGAGSVGARTGEVKRTATLRLDELAPAGLPLGGSTISTTKNGNYPRSELRLNDSFWRVVGLYLAEGQVATDPRGGWRLQWSFHPRREQHLVDEVSGYWLSQNVHAKVRATPTARVVDIRSRLLGTWWTAVLGLGRTSSEQRLPDLIWEQPESAKWALLSGLFEGDGSWSLINGGPSVIIELGTISDELADGVLRLLGDLGIVASRRVGRTSKSTKETHWIRIAGADQVERAIELVPKRDRPGVLASITRQQKRIAPTGHRRSADGPGWVRVTSAERTRFSGPVFSLEVPYAHTVVTSGGVTTSNCFPKDVSALKQLAGNSGYHFQLLTAVIEVNELQKRRVIGKLQKHLGSLVGKTVALLGLAFKANTDDMREASSLVLAARLQADGAQVRAYDPVAEEEARKLLVGVEFADSALDALDGADACIIVTEWPEFGDLDWAEAAERMAGRVVIDGRNYVDPGAVASAGLAYEGIGR